jgi:hypothetical protein
MNASIRHLAQPALDRQVCRLPIDDQAVLRKSARLSRARSCSAGWVEGSCEVRRSQMAAVGKQPVSSLSRLFWQVLDWLDYRVWDLRLRMADAL